MVEIKRKLTAEEELINNIFGSTIKIYQEDGGLGNYKYIFINDTVKIYCLDEECYIAHRLDGPAIVHEEGDVYWRFYGKDMNVSCQEEFERLIKLKGLW